MELMNKPPCHECGGSCCKYVALEIDKPVNKTDYDNIRWYLLHRNVNVFIDHERKWFVEFRSPCEALSETGACEVYEERPKICREHGNYEGECEYYSSPYAEYFSSEQEFLAYLGNRKIDWKFKKLRS